MGGAFLADSTHQQGTIYSTDLGATGLLTITFVRDDGLVSNAQGLAVITTTLITQEVTFGALPDRLTEARS